MGRMEVSDLEELVRHELNAPDEPVGAVGGGGSGREDGGLGWMEVALEELEETQDRQALLAALELQALAREDSATEASPAAWEWWMNWRG